MTIHGLSKSFGARPLFKNLSFSIEESERIGLIGPNGAGKSTLLKILASQMDADEGDVTKRRGLRLGYLEQAPQFSPQATVFSAILEGAAHPDDWEAQSAVHEYISRLELNQFGAEAAVETLSGGWQKRVALARELIKNPDLLLLDEPTNHLDMESILWLEEFLARAPFAVLTITHDRLFLQRLANRILELDPRHAGGILSVDGDYSHYVDVRQNTLLAQETREAALRNTLRRETQWLRQGAKARTTKQQARIERAGELAEEVSELRERNQTRQADLDFSSGKRSPKKLLEAKAISKAYGERLLFADFSCMLTPGSRLGLIGRNGAGKSTLIRVLLGTEAPSSGTIFRSEQLSATYFDQTREALDPESTVLKTVCPDGDHVVFQGRSIHVRSYLERFLFSSQQMEMKVGRLSGGEQSRLLIARLMLTPSNLLVLDEPTNDLDMATLSVLEDCLKEFDGALILVSHDRYFLDQVCNQLYAFPDVEAPQRQLIAFSDYHQWQQWKRQPVKFDKKEKVPEIASSVAKKNALTFTEQHELKNIETKIQKAEAFLEDLNREIAHPRNATDPAALKEFALKMTDAQADIDRLYRRWEELEAKAKL